MEITQFTYFQQIGGIDLAPISCEITYGLERIAMFLQRVDSIFDLEWGGGVKYGEVRLQEEIEQSKYAFGQVGMPLEEFSAAHRDLFDRNYALGETLLASGLLWPAPRVLSQVLAPLQHSRFERQHRSDRKNHLYPARPAARGEDRARVR
jgi:glycyl-tRNA synthetase alpha chain